MPTGWNARFGRELNATEDRPRFVPLGSRAKLLPIVEGKQLSPFQDRPLAVDPRASRSTTASRTRIAYRDVASATNKLTLIAAMLPAEHRLDAHRVLPEDPISTSGRSGACSGC